MPKTEIPAILTDGGLGGLVAAATAREARLAADPGALGPYAVLLLDVCPDLAQARAALGRQAEALGLEVLEGGCSSEDSGGAGGMDRSLVILEAAGAVLSRSGLACSELVWPVHSGVPGRPDKVDLDRAAAAADRALLVSRLVGLDAGEHGRPSFRIHAPYADFSDRQLAELALDLGVPLAECRWWGEDGAERERWLGVFRSLGHAAAAGFEGLGAGGGLGRD